MSSTAGCGVNGNSQRDVAGELLPGNSVTVTIDLKALTGTLQVIGLALDDDVRTM